MMGLGPSHILLLLIVVVLVFGTKKLRNAGRDLGEAVKGFKDGMKGEEEKVDQATKALGESKTINAEQKDKSHSA